MNSNVVTQFSKYVVSFTHSHERFALILIIQNRMGITLIRANPGATKAPTLP